MRPISTLSAEKLGFLHLIIMSCIFDDQVRFGATEDEDAIEELTVRRSAARLSNMSVAGTARAFDRKLLGPSVHHLSTTLLSNTVAAVTRIRLGKGHYAQKSFGALLDPGDVNIWQTVHSYVLVTTADLVCPRDGELGAAYVDYLAHSLTGCQAGDDSDEVGLATALLSYSWGNKLRSVTSALTEWVIGNQRDPTRTYIWICSLCLNQHDFENRVAKLSSGSGPEALQREFGERVVAIGLLLPMLDPWLDPEMLSRAWCLFEINIAIRNRESVEIDIILSASERQSFLNAINAEGYSVVDGAFAHIQSAKATATVAADLDAIRALIQSTPGGFETVDDTVHLYPALGCPARGASDSRCHGSPAAEYS